MINLIDILRFSVERNNLPEPLIRIEDVPQAISNLNLNGAVLSWTIHNNDGVASSQSITLPSGGGIVGEYVKEVRAIVNGVTVIRGDDSSYNVMVDESDLLKDLAAVATPGIYEINVDQHGLATLVRAASDSGGVTTQEVTSLIGNNVATWAIASNTDLIPSNKLPSSMSGGTVTNDLPSSSEVNFLRGNHNVPAGRSDFTLTAGRVRTDSSFFGYAVATNPSASNYVSGGSITITNNNLIAIYDSSGSIRLWLDKSFTDQAGKTPVSLHVGGSVIPLTYQTDVTIGWNENITSSVWRTDIGQDVWVSGQVIENVNVEFSDGSFLSQVSEAINTESKISLEDLKTALNIPEGIGADDQAKLDEITTNSRYSVVFDQNVGTEKGFSSGLISKIVVTNTRITIETRVDLGSLSKLTIGGVEYTSLDVNGLDVGGAYRYQVNTTDFASISNPYTFNIEFTLQSGANYPNTLTLSNKFNVSQAQGLPEIPEAQDVPLGFAYPVVEQLGSVSSSYVRGYAINPILIRDNTNTNINSQDLNLQFRGVKVSGLYELYNHVSNTSTLRLDLETAPSDTTLSGWTYSQVGGSHFFKTGTLSVGDSFETLFNELGITAGYPETPEAQDVPLGFAYPNIENIGTEASQGYRIGGYAVASTPSFTNLSEDLNLQFRGVKVLAIYSHRGSTISHSTTMILNSAPSNTVLSGWTYHPASANFVGDIGVKPFFRKANNTLIIGDSFETLFNELGITAGYPDAGGLTTEEQTKLNNSLRDLDLGTDGVLKVFDNNSTTNLQADIDEEFNLPTILERFFVTSSSAAALARLSEANIAYIQALQSKVILQHSETSQVQEDSTFGSNYFDYRSSSESYFSNEINYDDSTEEVSGLATSRSKLVSIKKGSSFGNHLGVKNASDLDVGIVRTDSNNILQVNSTGLRASSWVNVNSGSATSITINQGDTLLIEVNPHPFDNTMIRIEIDILRVNGTIEELNANDIPHNSFDWDTLILRDFTEIKGCDLNNYVGHDARRALLANHEADKWVFGKALLTTHTTDDVEVVGDLNVTGNLKIKGEAVDPSAGGGGTDITGAGYLHLGVANIEGGDTGLVAGTTGHAEADGDRMERALRFAVASTNVMPTGGSYDSATGNIILPEGHWLVCASVVVANNGTNKTDQNSRVRTILGIKYGDNIRHEQSDYSRWPNGATSRYSSAVDSDFSECKVSVAGGVISDGTTALTINLVTALQGQNPGSTDEACNILSAHVHAYKQVV